MLVPTVIVSTKEHVWHLKLSDDVSLVIFVNSVLSYFQSVSRSLMAPVIFT